MSLIAILAAANLWSNQAGIHTVSSGFVNWLIWGQFVACFSIKAVASIVYYRSQRYMPRKREPTLTNRVRELRSANGPMTQQDLADRVGVTRQTIVALEAGAYTPSLALALRIAREFSKKTDDVFHLEE